MSEKENEIQKLKIENNYMNQIKKYENEIQALKMENNDLVNKIKLLENNSNNNEQYHQKKKENLKTIKTMI